MQPARRDRVFGLSLFLYVWTAVKVHSNKRNEAKSETLHEASLGGTAPCHARGQTQMYAPEQ